MDNEFLAQVFSSDDNIQAIGDGPDGKKVMYVLNKGDAAPYIERYDGLVVIECSGFGVGPPYWLDTVQSSTYKNRMRPVPGGLSVGSYRISAGTVSCFVEDNETGELVLLSNNHVLANVDSCVVGDDILQPGAADGGQRSTDTVANLLRWVPIQVETTRYVDCAVARMKNQADSDQNVIALGMPHGMATPYIGQWLKKSGRTTETTSGVCAIINASVKVDYGPGLVKTIQDCILTGVPSAPGDSGSLMMDFASNAAVALLFAGGVSNGVAITVGCRMDRVEQLLNVTVPMPDPKQKRLIVDISHHQGDIDWDTLAPMVDGVMMKVAEGADFIDPRFPEYYTEARKRNLIVLGYDFLKSKASAQAHYDNWLRAIGDRKLDAPPVMDCEDTDAKNYSVDHNTALVQQFGAKLADWYGCDYPIIYTAQWWWDVYIKRWEGWKKYPLHVASWVNVGGLYPLLPIDWKGVTGQPVMWQFRVFKGGGETFGVSSADIDLNTTYPSFELLLGNQVPPPEKVSLIVNFVGYGYVEPYEGEFDYGTSVQLEAFPSDGWEFLHWEGDLIGSENPITLVMNSDKTVTAVFVEDEGDELATEEHYLGLVKVNGLRIRSDAGTSYSIVGSLPFGQEVEILEKKKDKFDNDWVRIGNKQWSAQYYKESTGWKEYIQYMLKKFL